MKLSEVEFQGRLNRLQEAEAFLNFKKIAKSRKELSKLMGRGVSGVSQAFNGNRSYLTDKFLRQFCSSFPIIRLDWLMHGLGEMSTEEESYLESTDNMYFSNHDNSKHQEFQDEPVPLYDIEVTAGVVTIFKNPSGSVPIGEIKIPRMPKCDGAVAVTGDSMYPLIKSGDYVLFKTISDLPQSILYGNMYIISLDIEGDEIVMVKYVQEGRTPNHLNLVSENKHHADKEIHIKNILGMALVKASVRFNFST